MADQALLQTIARAQQTLRAAGRLRPFHRGNILMAMGEPSGEVLLVESGLVKVVLPATSGIDVLIGLHGRVRCWVSSASSSSGAGAPR